MTSQGMREWRWLHFKKCWKRFALPCGEDFALPRGGLCADARSTRGLVTHCESDAQGGEELGAEINLISASDSLPLKNPPLLRQSLRVERLQIRFKLFLHRSPICFILHEVRIELPLTATSGYRIPKRNYTCPTRRVSDETPRYIQIFPTPLSTTQTIFVH